ncbi:MAG: TolC family protein [Flavobacteriales bacterium]
MTKFNKILLLVSLALHICADAMAQADSTAAGGTSFTLLQAQEYAIKNSFAVKSVKYDADVAGYDTEGLKGIGLPQVNGTVQYLNNIYAPYNIIPAGSFGPEEVRVRFQQPHNVTIGVTASQLLFDGTWLVGLEAARSYELLQKKKIQKAEIDVKNDIADAYYLAVVSKENAAVLQKFRDALSITYAETQAYYEAGLVEKQDVDQLSLDINNIDIQIAYAQEQQRFTRDLLKYQMGYPLENEINLTDDATVLMSLDSQSLLSAPFAASQNIDVMLAQSGLRMQQLNLKAKKAAYLPNLGAAWTIQTQAQRGEFNFFDTSKPYLYGNFLAIQMNVPILSGGQRKYATKKVEVEIQRMKDMEVFASQSAELEYRNARMELSNAVMVYESALKSLQLAQEIYDTSEVKFREGIGSSMDLTQRSQQVVAAEGNRIQAMLKLLQAKNRLAKALNQY